eukprot:5005350-Pyramimonas_sp.AAC.1
MGPNPLNFRLVLPIGVRPRPSLAMAPARRLEPSGWRLGQDRSRSRRGCLTCCPMPPRVRWRWFSVAVRSCFFGLRSGSSPTWRGSPSLGGGASSRSSTLFSTMRVW